MKSAIKLTLTIALLLCFVSCGAPNSKPSQADVQSDFIKTNELQVLSSAVEYSGSWNTQINSDVSTISIDNSGNVTIQSSGATTLENLVKNKEGEIFITDKKHNQLLRVYASGSYLELYKPNGFGYSLSKKKVNDQNDDQQNVDVK
jgi:hypothetical protein